MILYDNHHLL